jgi:glucosamine-6-phosphate deaminase
MAGTMNKIVKEGHEVHVAYQTSGNIGVFDHDAMRFDNFVTEFAKYFKLENTPHIEEMEKLVESS